MIAEPTRVFDILDVISSRPKEQVMFSSLCNGQWREYTVENYLEYSARTSYALIRHGVTKGEPILSITHNRAEFNFVDMGILQTGAVHVPVYPAVDVAKLTAILNETQARIAFISNRSVLRKIQQVPSCALKLVVSFDNTEGATFYEDFLNEASANEEFLHSLKSAVEPNDTASIIYLSGSNTPLRGVMLSHAAHIFNVLNNCKSHPFAGCRQSLSILPLAHSFERTANYSFQILEIKICYSDGITSAFGLVKSTQPDVLMVVPLMLERIIQSTANEILKIKGIKGWLAKWLLRQAAREEAGPGRGKISLKSLLFRSAFKGLRNSLGGNIKVIVCGGAALKPNTLSILWAAGINTYEGYGLTEAGPLVAYNLKTSFKSQSVGKPMPGVEVKIAGDGEVLVKTGGVMNGYFKQNTTAVDTDGWLHTGDVGIIDKSGFLTLTGIKKAIFKLSSGLYTDPRPIESWFQNSSFINKIWIYGHNREFLTAFIIPELTKSSPSTKLVEVKSIIQNEIDAYNSTCPKYEQILHFELVADEWNTANRLLNQDGSLNRHALYSKYNDMLEKIYR